MNNNIHISGLSGGKNIQISKTDSNLLPPSLLSPDQVEQYTTKKCSRCKLFYNDISHEPCFYHPGTYIAFTVENGRLAGWTCCRQLPGSSQDPALSFKQLGCTQKSRHWEDRSFSAALHQFPIVATSDELIGSKGKNVIQEEEEEEVKLKEKNKNNQEDKEEEDYFIHLVKGTDTLVGLSLKYKCSIGELQKINKLSFNEQLWGKKNVYIPKSEQNKNVVIREDEESEGMRKRKKVREFLGKINGKNYHVKIVEAEIYLEEAGWDVEKAVEEWKEDQKWEEENKMLSPESKEKEREREKVRKEKERKYGKSKGSKKGEGKEEESSVGLIEMKRIY